MYNSVFFLVNLLQKIHLFFFVFGVQVTNMSVVPAYFDP